MNLEDTITVVRENWERLALATGDNNPIHFLDGYKRFGLSRPICPGIYLLSIAEQRARKNGFFTPPIHISASFNTPVFENQILNFEEKSDAETYLLTYKINTGSNLSSIASFIFNNLSYTSSQPTLDMTTNFSSVITENELDSFNKNLGVNENESIYSTFIIGRILKYFLINREGALLHNLSFNFFKEVRLGTIDFRIDITEKAIPKKNRINYQYEVHGKVYQNNQVISSGIGKGFLRKIIN